MESYNYYSQLLHIDFMSSNKLLVNYGINNPPPTPYGLIYAPNDPNIQSKIVFYKVSGSNPAELQYSLNWGETWVDQSEYIVWTTDDVIGTISSTEQLEAIVDTLDPDPLVPSRGDPGIITLKPFDQFVHGQMLISSSNPSWSLNSEGIFGNVTDCPTINGIEVKGGCDIRALGHNTTTTQIDVTKYVG